MEKIILLQLKAIDFKNADFIDNESCAISNACRRQLSANIVSEGVVKVKIDGKEYEHNMYLNVDFEKDKAIAFAAEWSEDVAIRTIVLTQILNNI